MRRIYCFNTSEEARVYCETTDTVEDGDILFIPKENVVGCSGAWPFAITKFKGNLHALTSRVEMTIGMWNKADEAIQFAKEMGYETREIDIRVENDEEE